MQNKTTLKDHEHNIILNHPVHTSAALHLSHPVDSSAHSNHHIDSSAQSNHHVDNSASLKSPITQFGHTHGTLPAILI